MAVSLSPDAWVVEDASQQKLPGRYIASALQGAGMRVRRVDWTGNADILVAEAMQTQPRLIVFSGLFANHLDKYLDLIPRLRAAGVGAHMAMAGHLPALNHTQLLNACPALDSVICGEPETVAAELARSLDDPNRLHALPGLACRSPESRLNPPAKFGDLDDLATPLHDDALPSFGGVHFATIQASRGCYNRCTFCLPRAFYHQRQAPYRLRSIPNLVDEIEVLYHRGVRLFLFDDEQFLPPAPMREARIRDLENELQRRGLDIAFTIKCRGDDVDPALFARLQRMGLLRVYVGIESGCQTTLDHFGKGVIVEQNGHALAVLDKLGIVADFGCLVFHPWSTFETIQAEIAFLGRVLPHVPTIFNFWELEVYPGTPLAERVLLEQKGKASIGRICNRIDDPRAASIRQQSASVFTSGGTFAEFQNSLTQDWFEYLLSHRFHPTPSDAARYDTLKRVAERVNTAALDIWERMLECRI